MRTVIILVKGHESKQYYALWIIVGLFYNITYVKMKGPNKTLRIKKKKKNHGIDPTTQRLLGNYSLSLSWW